MLWWKRKTLKSKLFSQKSFFEAFLKDLENCQKEVIIESPYITASRMELLYPIFKKLISRGVKVRVVTRDPIDHDEYMRNQATNQILFSMELGITIALLRGFHHRKLAVIDRSILWEGSLNILSYSFSQEIMRRIEDEAIAKQMITFLKTT